MTASRLRVSLKTCLLLLSVTAQVVFARSVTPLAPFVLNQTVPQYLEQYSIPGAAVAVIHDGNVIWMRGFGFADLDSRRPVTADTLFNVGSISKTVTAWGVLHLAGQRQWDLDRPINDYLHRWQVPASSLAVQQVTARRLLSHTAGMSQHGYGGSDPAKPAPPIEDSLSGKTGAGAVTLVFPPGSNFAYSGANYSILQLAIEEISGRPFAQYMTEQVFQPLRMAHSAFELPRDLTPMATPYDTALKPLPLLRYNEASAAGLTTSLRDLATFAAAALDASANVVSPDLLKEAMRPVPNTQWATQDPFGPAPQYGLGYNVRPEQFGPHTGIGHGGTNLGWESWFQVIPQTGDGIVILTNSSNGSALIAAVLCDWRRRSFPQQPCPTIDAKIPLLAEYRARGTEAALKLHARFLKKHAREYELGTGQLNSLGYQVMRTGDLPGAIRFFELNARLFPGEWNVHDSLGEAYAAANRREDAIRSYRRSVELNPGNENGKQALRNLVRVKP